MSNFQSNEYWQSDDPIYEPFELRAHRFRPEMRPVFFGWLGIRPDSRVLDAGCGSGVFTRFLAQGLTSGHITGCDINRKFLAYGRDKHASLGLADRITLDWADGYHLPYPDGSFDAVTNYTYLGCLADPDAGLREMARVCRPGGVVSYVVARTAIPPVAYAGDYPFAGAAEMKELAQREAAAWFQIQNPQGPGQLGETGLFARCGLSDIAIYPFAHLICYSDAALPLETRREIALGETADEIRFFQARYAEREQDYVKLGFGPEERDKLLELSNRKLAYLTEHFYDDRSYEWHGGFHFIVVGKRE